VQTCIGQIFAVNNPSVYAAGGSGSSPASSAFPTIDSLDEQAAHRALELPACVEGVDDQPEEPSESSP